MAERSFTIQELRRNGDGARDFGPNPDGERFEWSRVQHSTPGDSWKLPVKQRTSRDDYPGSEEPSEQVLGWNYEPFTLSGRWDDQFMGANAARGEWERFEQMVQRGNPVLIQFERVSVYGIITDFQPDMRLASLVFYSFTVSPHYRDKGQTVRPIAVKERVDPGVLVAEARTIVERMEAQNLAAKATYTAPPPFQLSTDLLGLAEGYVEELTTSVAALEQIIKTPLDFAQDAGDSFRRMAARLSYMKTSALALSRIYLDVAVTTNLAYETADATLAFEAWTRGQAYQGRLAWLAAYRAHKDVNRLALPKALALHRTSAGESLYGISNRYYGTPHEWRRIYERNNLSSIELDGDELLIIPTA